MRIAHRPSIVRGRSVVAVPIRPARGVCSSRMLLGIDAPVVLIRYIRSDVLPRYQAGALMGLPADGFFLVAVGVVWYGVMLNIESWRNRQSVFNFKFLP